MGRTTSFQDQAYLRCTQRIIEPCLNPYVCRSNKEITMLRKCSNLFVVLHMQGHFKKCVELYYELANKTTQKLYKISSPCIDEHHSKGEEVKPVENYQKHVFRFFFGIVLDTKKLINLKDRSKNEHKLLINDFLALFLTFITYVNTNSIFMWEKLLTQCKLTLFQDSDFTGDLEDAKSTSGGTLCVFGSHTFVPISWVCKKQTSVSHSSTKSEIISLDIGLRLVCPLSIYGIQFV